MNQSFQPSLRQVQAFECPKCHQNNLARSDDPNVNFICPDPACGYVLWATPPSFPCTAMENH